MRRQLGVAEGIPLAFGSIMGSGILFLPALTFYIAHSNVILGWIIATFLCIPLLFIFKDMFSRVSNESGISGYVKMAFGKPFGSTTSVLFLATVILGMPCASVIAGSYLASSLHLSKAFAFLFALTIPWLAWGANVRGVKFGSRVQGLATVILVFVSVTLIFLTFNQASISAPEVANRVEIKPLFLCVATAFWAFAGFENISFMANDFRNPKRDLMVCSAAALVMCSLIYIGLAYCYSSLVPLMSVDITKGLLQLSQFTVWSKTTSAVVGVFAFTAVLLNFNSWMWGISRLMYAEAKEGNLPKMLSHENDKSIPSNGVFVLATLFSFVIIIISTFPGLLQSVLVLVGGNFVLIYVICTVAFICINKNYAMKIFGVCVCFPLLFAALQTGWSLAYPALVMCVAMTCYKNREINEKKN